jgi:FkbM family methyltransferase
MLKQSLCSWRLWDSGKALVWTEQTRVRAIESDIGMRARLALRLMDLCGYATGAINHRGFYNLTKRVGRLGGANAKVTLRLNDDSLYELLIGDPYWNRLIHKAFLYEPEIYHFFELLKGVEFAFVDGGANWGFWSVLASSRTYGSVETIAYEPMPETFAYLQRNAAINAERFKVVAKAIAATAMKDIPMTASAGAEASAVGASIVKDLGPRGDAVYVDAEAIDDVLGSLTSDSPVVIKLDLEGVERSVIEGCTWIDQHDCLLLFEDHAKDPDCEVTAAVLEKGWPIYFFHDDGRLNRIESVQQAAELKTISNRGYNFFGAHPGGVFDQLLGAQMGAS